MESSVFPTLFTLLGDIRAFVNNGISALPLTIIGTSLLLSLMSANYALLFMLMCMIVFVPSGLFLGNLGLEFITQWFSPPSSQLFGSRTSELCDIITPFPAPTEVDVVRKYTFGSYWLAMMAFFFGYAITNAVSLLQKDTQMPVNADDTIQQMVISGQNNRKTQAISAIMTTVIFAIIIFGMRIINSECESYVFSSISVIAFSILGVTMYNWLASVGQDRLSDIFGIANRLLSPDSLNNVPYACLPPAASS